MQPSRVFALACLLAALTLFRLPAQMLAQSPGPEPAAAPIAVMVELAAPPAAVVYAQQLALASGAQSASAVTPAQAATAAAQAQVAAIAAAQAALRQELHALEAPILFSVQRVYNGVAVLADAEQRAAIAGLHDVVGVHPLVPKQPDVSSSGPYLGIPALWQGTDFNLPGGLRGEGIRLAIVDTGIDYLHRDFGGPGAGYLQNDRAVIGDIAGFPGVRVVGGYDFVGDDYNAAAGESSARQIPQPDPDPMDCYGHGTHVAGIAGGSGVTRGHTTYDGPYDASIDPGSLHIGPGVAPRASLYALKVFGCFGSTNLTDAAIEWAVDPNGDGDFSDRMDVVNLSLGSPYGWEYDTSAIAANNAALVGVIVVASAGNSGDIQLITSAPGSAERAISVAATQRTSDQGASFSARGPRRGDAGLKPDVAAPGASIVSADAGSGFDRVSSSGTSMAAPHVAGIMALLRQAHPLWSVEELKALAMNTAQPLVARGEGLDAAPWLPTRTGAGRIDPPAALRAGAVAYLADGSGRVGVSFGAPAVTGFYTATQEIELANKSAAPLAFAPAYNSLSSLPGVTITVPGGPILVPAGGRQRVPVTLHVAAAALQHRQTPADAGSYLLTTWFAEEGGHLFLWPSGITHTISMPPGTPGLMQQAGPAPAAEFDYAPANRTLTYTITLGGIDAAGIATATLGYGRPGSRSSALAALPLPAGGAQIAGSLPLSAAAERSLAGGLLHLRLDGPGLAAGPLRGQLVFSQEVLHLPIYAAPEPAAAMQATAMQATPGNLTFSSGAVQTLQLTGADLQAGVAPTNTVSLASVLELKLRSPNTRPAWLDANAPDRFDHADLQYVGVTADAALGHAAPPDAARLYFAITTWGDWSTPSEIGVNVLLDTNEDGEYEYRLANGTPTPPVFGFGPIGPLLSQLYDVASGQLIAQQPLNGVDPAQYDTNLFFTNGMILPVRLADLGLDADAGTIQFVVRTTSVDTIDSQGKFIDRTPVLRYNPAQPALQFSPPPAAAPTYLDQHGAEIGVTLNPQGYLASPTAGVLVLHHHNRRIGLARADAIAVSYRWPYTMYLPLLGREAAQ